MEAGSLDFLEVDDGRTLQFLQFLFTKTSKSTRKVV